jgi:hypothetical protein
MEMHADDDFTLAFDYASGATAERVQNPLWRVTEVFFGARLRKSIAIVKTHGKQIVDTAIRDRERGGKDTTTTTSSPRASGSGERLDRISGSLIQSLLDSIGDRGIVADSALNYLSAGRQACWLGLSSPYRAPSKTLMLTIMPPARSGYNCTSTDVDIPPAHAPPLHPGQDPP